MTIAIYPGSFDPITNGHLDILKSEVSKIRQDLIVKIINEDVSALSNLNI